MNTTVGSFGIGAFSEKAENVVALAVYVKMKRDYPELDDDSYVRISARLMKMPEEKIKKLLENGKI